MLVSNALLALTWNYIQPLIEKTREELEMHGEDSAADALEDLLGDEVSSGAPLPTGKSQTGAFGRRRAHRSYKDQYHSG